VEEVRPAPQPSAHESPPSRRVLAAKRTLDIGLASIALVLLAPLVAVLLAGSTVVFRANPLFVQTRVGRHGRPIRVPKIRSIPANSPPTADKHALAQVPIPRWGRMLRRSHLDELPQLWPVLIGRMSLIGPRPEMPWLAERFTAEHVALRATVRPGITGLWQISDASGGLIHERPEYDLFYVCHLSIALDLWIAIRTIRLYLPGGDAVTLNDLPRWVNPPTTVVDDYVATSEVSHG
jgi:lipopolysaccharide/colanic/teichoic acid biosynthesis glycosyltransferase